MESFSIILALGWISNLFVHAWINLMSKTKTWITAKPFSCQECMGAWIGLAYAIYYKENIIIFAGLSSLSAVLISTILDRLNR